MSELLENTDRRSTIEPTEFTTTESRRPDLEDGPDRSPSDLHFNPSVTGAELHHERGVYPLLTEDSSSTDDDSIDHGMTYTSDRNGAQPTESQEVRA